jgi:hypothetical protein
MLRIFCCSLLIVLANSLFANDWFFKDSEKYYAGARLQTILSDGDKIIQFRFANYDDEEVEVEGIRLPNLGYNRKALRDFIGGRDNLRFKSEMLDMLKISGESASNAAPFLRELNQVLRAFNSLA